MNALSIDIEVNEAHLRQQFEDCSDIVFRSFKLSDGAMLLLVYLDGLTHVQSVEDNILRPLLFNGLPQGEKPVPSLAERMKREWLPLANVQTVDSSDALVQHILRGSLGLLVNGEAAALIAQIPGFEERSIQEPKKEATLRGSKEGFVENLRTNTSLLRRRIIHEDLKMESFTIGSYTQTEVVLAYVKGLADENVLSEVRKKLGQIDMKGIIDSAYLEEWLEGSSYSIFSQIQNTERPDIVAASLLEGKVTLIANGSPFALILPITFWSGLQSADDYFERFVFVILTRAVRYAMTFISFALPAIYVALSTFHPEMVPANLMISIATARENSPFPTVIEVFIMMFIFDALQEAGVHLPNQLGPVGSIIGALVIGQAAVEAGIISTPIIIVISLTGIAAFTIPRYSATMPFRLTRYMILFITGFLGFVGFAYGIIFLLIHLVMLESFGTPFFRPVAPFDGRRIKDIFIRYPFWIKNGRNKKGGQQ
ncbi:spore germination protein [Paenibacillus sacheonensis]|uniref:Spore germination protein n=1 Tax=Paenibacillus sacheonensis TaxID=742054 RepID=A0A7X4YJW5_9BACL|nr:spore germination protein [Paenibacillus sacheonensis]MBM7563890.1 spore germination protein KA [Paenibacillus sacheonensis]NBC67763.1 spore germination protein [Paenibacillus sacheonensis]